MTQQTLRVMFGFGLVVVIMMMTTILSETMTQNSVDQTEPRQVSWDLTEIYPTDEAWTREKERLELEIKGLSQYEGTLGESAAALRVALDALHRKVQRHNLFPGTFQLGQK